MIIWIVSSSVFFILFNWGEIYILSSVLPQKIRRKWIKLVYPTDFGQWENYNAILHDHFPYYKLLNDQEKSEFLVRLMDFKNRLPIEGREGLNVDEQKQVLLCASLSQITFGYNDFRFDFIEKIVIYPHIFFSKFLNKDVKGITYSTGYVYISWQDFEEGYEDVKNKLNLGLHEFAHALMLEKESLFDSISFDEFSDMENQLSSRKAASGQDDPLFRNYGFTNISEFWAVSVEVFFEQPIQYRETYPNMYKITSRLLRQDMAQRLESYVSQNSPFEKANTLSA